jgi:hypothetical protein
MEKKIAWALISGVVTFALVGITDHWFGFTINAVDAAIFYALGRFAGSTTGF